MKLINSYSSDSRLSALYGEDPNAYSKLDELLAEINEHGSSPELEKITHIRKPDTKNQQLINEVIEQLKALAKKRS